MRETMTFYNRAPLFRVASITWFGLGLFLMTRGIDLVVQDAPKPMTSELPGTEMSPMFHWICNTLTGQPLETSLFLIIIGLLIGMVKSKVIFQKVVQRNTERILSIEGQHSLFQAFAPKDYIVMVVMMLFGMLLRTVGVYDDIRGIILIAVGAGLIQGAVLYIRQRQSYLHNTLDQQ